MNKRKRDVILALPNSQLAAQLESFGDFYTKKLSLIKLRLQFIDLFTICKEVCFSPLLPFSSLGVFTLYFGSNFCTVMERHHGNWPSLLRFFFLPKIDGTSIQHLGDGLICIRVCISSGVG